MCLIVQPMSVTILAACIVVAQAFLRWEQPPLPLIVVDALLSWSSVEALWSYPTSFALLMTAMKMMMRLRELAIHANALSPTRETAVGPKHRQTKTLLIKTPILHGFPSTTDRLTCKLILISRTGR